MKTYSAVWEKKKVLFDLTKGKKGERVLDFGSGDGAYLPVLLEHFREVYALEKSQERLKHLKDKFSLQKRMKVISFQSKKIPFVEKFFDLVWASEVLEHQKDFSLIDEWERVSKDLVVISVPNPAGLYWQRDKTHILPYTLATLKNFFRQRKNFSYQIYGLGFCWPEKFGLTFLRRIFLSLTWEKPALAWSWLILGKRKLNG